MTAAAAAAWRSFKWAQQMELTATTTPGSTINDF